MRRGYKRWLAILMLVVAMVVQTACGQQELPYQMGGNQGGTNQAEADAAQNASVIGDSAKEKVAQIIQSRVQIYVDENR